MQDIYAQHSQIISTTTTSKTNIPTSNIPTNVPNISMCRLELTNGSTIEIESKSKVECEVGTKSDSTNIEIEDKGFDSKREKKRLESGNIDPFGCEINKCNSTDAKIESKNNCKNESICIGAKIKIEIDIKNREIRSCKTIDVEPKCETNKYEIESETETDILEIESETETETDILEIESDPSIKNNQSEPEDNKNVDTNDNSNNEKQENDEEPSIKFERRPSIYFLLERDTMLVLSLAGFKLKPHQQERLYWNLVRLLNALEDEEKSTYKMNTCYAREEKSTKSHETFDGGGYGIFWDEYRSIEQSTPPSASVLVPDNEDGGTIDKSEREIQWLNDVGFTNIAKKIRARREIDQDDDDMKIIAASLTRAQANAVRRRIDSLNEAIRQRKLNDNKMPSTIATTSKRRHVKDIFGQSDEGPLTMQGSPEISGQSVNGPDGRKHEGMKFENTKSGDYQNTDVWWTSSQEVTKNESRKSDVNRSRSMLDRPAVLPKSDPITRNKSFNNGFPQQETAISGNVRNDAAQNLSTFYAPTQPEDQQQTKLDNLIQRASYTNSITKTSSKSTSKKESKKKMSITEKISGTKTNVNENSNNSESAPNIVTRDKVSSKNTLNDMNSRLSTSFSEMVSRLNTNESSVEKSEQERPQSDFFPRNLKSDEENLQFKSNEMQHHQKQQRVSPDKSPQMLKGNRTVSDTIIIPRTSGENYRRYSDTFTLQQHGQNTPPSKRLVVVDSGYISVSSVGDSYTTVNRDNKPTRSIANRTPRSSENLTEIPDNLSDDQIMNKTDNVMNSTQNIYQDDDSLKPFDASIDITLSQGFSGSSSSMVIDEEFSRGSYEPDGSALSQNRKFEVTDVEKSSPREKTKEKKRSNHREKSKLVDGQSSTSSSKPKHKNKHKHTDSKSNKTKEHLDNKSHSSKPSSDTSKDNKNDEVLQTTLLSDDSRSVDSLGSVGSADDLQVNFTNNSKSFGSNTKTHKLKQHSYDSNTDSEHRTSPEKGLESIGGSFSDLSLSPRTQSPQCLEGDAKLNVGSSSSPRETDRTAKNTTQGPSFPKLPNFTLGKEEMGMTHIGDLSEVDMNRIRSLALIELTALFDAYSISMNRRKPSNKIKIKDQGTFGVSLTTLCSREESKQNPDVKSPQVFREMLRQLEKQGLYEEGILRIPGSMQRVKGFREEVDKHPDCSTVAWDKLKMTDISTCLKQFLRDLPIPLLSYEYQNTFTSVADLPDRKVQLQALNLLVLLLPPVHQETLKLLLVFLNKVVTEEAYNKMGLNNVAMIMAPNLFFHNNAKISIDEAQKAAGMTDVLRMLIKYQRILWTIPAFMVSQIRFLYDAGAKTKDPKVIKKLICKKKIDSTSSGVGITVQRPSRGGSSGDELEEFVENLIIRVKAPTLNKQSMAIQLTTQTTVSEVIAKFQWKRQKSNKEKDEISSDRLKLNVSKGANNMDSDSIAGITGFQLYEVGGNIGERRLEGSACISAILRENPNAEWVLKSEQILR